MNKNVKEIKTFNYSNVLFNELLNIIEENNLQDHNQISLQSVLGDDDWTSSCGVSSELPYRERLYCTLNKSLEGTHLQNLIEENNQFYRWRAMKIPPRSAGYSIHYDGQGDGTVTNVRCHIPVITNDQAYMIFFGKNKNNLNPTLFHFEVGKVYEVNTTDYHSAVNFGAEDRWHLIGVKYEDSNYWS